MPFVYCAELYVEASYFMSSVHMCGFLLVNQYTVLYSPDGPMRSQPCGNQLWTNYSTEFSHSSKMASAADASIQQFIDIILLKLQLKCIYSYAEVITKLLRVFTLLHVIYSSNLIMPTWER